MARSGSPSLSINGIPPQLLADFLERSRREGWVSKNQVVIELMRMYATGEINLNSPAPVMEDSNAAKEARRHGLPIHGRMIHVGTKTWVVWVQGFKDDQPNSSWLWFSLLLQAVGSPPLPLTLIVTKEQLIAEHREGDTGWIIDALSHWLRNPERGPVLNLNTAEK